VHTEIGSGTGGPQGVLAFFVANGSRLVIEYVDASCFLASPDDVVSLGGFRLSVLGGGMAEYELPIQRGISPIQVIANQLLRAYADPGTEVSLHISGLRPLSGKVPSATCGALPRRAPRKRP
jgi:hypothetical protein